VTVTYITVSRKTCFQNSAAIKSQIDQQKKGVCVEYHYAGVVKLLLGIDFLLHFEGVKLAYTYTCRISA
jgi:hypothetical protein